MRSPFTATTFTLFALACGRTELDVVAASDAATVEAHAPTCDPTSPFTSISPLTIDTASFDEQDIRFTPDELTAYFGSNRAKEPGWGNDAFAAHRNTADGAFDKPFIVTVGNGAAPWFGGSVYTIQGGAIAYFTAYVGSSKQGIGRSLRVDEADFGPIEVVQIEGAPEEQATPVVSEDETELFFMSYPIGTLWMATRHDTTKPFANAHVLEPLVNDLASYASWISPDGCRLYFTRSLETDAGTQSDVLVASR